MDTLQSFKLSGGFYFSYDIDLSSTLSDNLVSKEALLQAGFTKKEKQTMNLKDSFLERGLDSVKGEASSFA